MGYRLLLKYGLQSDAHRLELQTLKGQTISRYTTPSLNTVLPYHWFTPRHCSLGRTPVLNEPKQASCPFAACFYFVK